MNMFIWNQHMQIDNGFVDDDHRRLFEIANEIMAIHAPDRDAAVLKQLIRQLYEYVRSHFEREEQYMERLGYPGLEEHKLKHEAIIRDMNHHLNTSYHLGQALGNFRQLMNIWVVDHILEEDKKIYRFILENE